jgi:tetratricopeptide (TPR) repeat protein
MSVTLETRQQLAAPRLLRSLPPFLGPASEDTALPFDRPELPPSFVTTARALVDRNPGSATALARLAQAEQAAGNGDEAIAAARAALAQARRQPDQAATLAAIIVLEGTDHARDAEDELDRLTVDGPLGVVHARLAADRGAYEEALRRLGSHDSSDAWALRGWINLKQREFRAAIACFRRTMRIAGPSPSVLTNVGLAHAALGERKRAIAETRQALFLVPSQTNRVGFNLASYYLAGGEFEGALAIVRSLQEQRPRDIQPLFAEARIHLSMGRTEQAQRPLRRARTALWAYLTDVERAELEANLAFLEWHLDGLSTRAAAAKVIRELQRIDYRSLRIAGMLPVLLPHFSDVGLFNTLLAQLRKAHPREPLDALEVHRAVLERRFDDAADHAARWARQSVFDAEPAITATLLLCDVACDFESAIEIGRLALRRTPAATVLQNNLAYALALAGRPDDARRHMPVGDTPHEIATRALIALRAGNVEAARRGYTAAFSAAKASRDPVLPALVALHTHMAFEDFAPVADRPHAVVEGVTMPDAWEDDRRFAVALTMMQKRRLDPPSWLGAADAASVYCEDQ